MCATASQTVQEEALLLTMVDTDAEPALYNRRVFVKSLAVSLSRSVKRTSVQPVSQSAGH